MFYLILSVINKKLIRIFLGIDATDFTVLCHYHQKPVDNKN